MQKLLGHLAQFATFSKQAELLCTQSLSYLLANPEAKRAFAQLLSSVAKVEVDTELSWHAESRQANGARPDLEGRDYGGAPAVKVEAKLGATLGKRQLGAYRAAFTDGTATVVLAVLVPKRRYEEICACEGEGLHALGVGLWHSVQGSRGVRTVVLTWEETLEALERVPSEALQADLQQLRAMFHVLNGDVMEPLAHEAEVLAWRVKEQWWNTLVDLTTRRLTPAERNVYPLGLERRPVPYYRRYICQAIGGVESCFSIGTRDPFAGHGTPIWLRFNSRTGHYARIRAELDLSGLLSEAVQSQGHIWYPLEVPVGQSRDEMIGALVRQSVRVLEPAYSFVTDAVGAPPPV